MKYHLKQKELAWTLILGLIIWNIGLTLREIPNKIVTLDISKVVHVATKNLTESSEGEVLDSEKDKLAQQLRFAVNLYAITHNVVVVQSPTIIGGDVVDITDEIIREFKW